jgi:hypothetical protein
MIRHLFAVLLVLLFALPLFGLREEQGDGLVFGYEAAFKVTAPPWLGFRR